MNTKINNNSSKKNFRTFNNNEKYTEHKREILKKYIKENFPKKKFVYKIRPRKPGEIFIGEILFALFLVFMLLMLIVNYYTTEKYKMENLNKEKNITEIEINVDIDNTQNNFKTQLPMQILFIKKNFNIHHL
ncbi:MAG: hypothetical protein QW757_01605 [Candidatus Woesearchaeota archaeon]